MHTQIANSEPIPGYHVRSCLGTGGYGEVWSAEAPGGLAKAIKFVYGFHNDKRAAIELKALERIKQVRHPFLLSIERIEIIAGQLVIVMELADGSLRDRLNECRRKGQPGIPRLELLRYLRDTADALDFMAEQHSLQHLDIKPENLLLLSGRIKVADFGLVKNFRHVTASLMSGLTPLYAAPELFHGTPSHCSDQYSLAMVYQELCTGLLPFQADSPAQLTLQHLHEVPDLSSLPEMDRPIIARALAKDPLRRFPSCGEVVEALTRAGLVAVSAPEVIAPFDPRPPQTSDASLSHKLTPVCKTLVCDQPVAEPMSAAAISLDLPPLPEPRVGPLVPLPLDEVEHRAIPTLIVGIGGTAGYVLRHLRRRIVERYGTMAHVPAVSLLLLDTNSQSLAATTCGSDSSALSPDETLDLPLRRPQQYRAESARFLRWMSRRWLYNIPRSLKTEGLRPLGRLAFVDHSKVVYDRLRDAIRRIVHTDSITATEQHTSLQFRPGAARVYLVASISGGTGGGIVIDLAYAVQALLQQLGVLNEGVLGVLTHSTGTNPRHREVARINAFSWLMEYHHYNRPDGHYPGDGSCGLAGSSPGQKTFRHTYLMHLGDGLAPEDLAQATGPVADYIYLDAMTPAGRLLDACRAVPCDSSPAVAGQAPLRTFGIARATVIQHDILRDAAIALSRDVVSAWLGRSLQETATNRLSAELSPWRSSADRTQEAGRSPGIEPRLPLEEFLGKDLFVSEAQRILAAELGSDASDYFKSMLAQTENIKSCTTGDMMRSIHRVLGLVSADAHRDELPDMVLMRALRDLVQPSVVRLAAELRRRAMRYMDEPGASVPGARQALQRARMRLDSMAQETERAIRVAREQRRLSLETARLLGDGAETRVSSKHAELLLQYFLQGRDECVLQIAIGLTRALRCELDHIQEKLIHLERELDGVLSIIAKAGGDFDLLPGDSFFDFRSLVKDTWKRNHVPWVASLQERLALEFVTPSGGLGELIAANRSRELADRILSTARQVVLDGMGSIEIMGQVLASGSDARNATPLERALQAATPPLLEFGGLKHMVAMLPQGGDRESHSDTLRGALGDAASSVLVGRENEFTICCEAGGLSLKHLATRLIEGRPDYAELARRVQTRQDVDWTVWGSPRPRPASDASVAPSVSPTRRATETETYNGNARVPDLSAPDAIPNFT